MRNQQHDLIIRGGRVIDPSQCLDAIRDIAVIDGRIVAVEERIAPGRTTRVINATGEIIVPGLIDLHVHLSHKRGGLGIAADPIAARTGVTTMVDAGTAGTSNFQLFREQVIERSKTRILAFLNVCRFGITSADLRDEPAKRAVDDLLDSPDRILAVFEKNQDVIVGLKLRVDYRYRFSDDEMPLRHARLIADEIGVPLMVHAYLPPPAIGQILPFLKPGDILTHAFSRVVGLIDETGDIHSEAVSGKGRGVVFDVGHGMSSFDFEIARDAMDHRFSPDTISTDLHALSVNGPAYDLPTTMSKWLHLGMSLQAVIDATTRRPSQVIKREHELGALRPGHIADVAILRVEKGDFELRDCAGNCVRVKQRLISAATIRQGRVC